MWNETAVIEVRIMENGEESWAIPTIGNHIRTRYRINRSNGRGTALDRPYIKENRDRKRGTVNWAQVRSALQEIGIDILGDIDPDTRSYITKPYDAREVYSHSTYE